MKQMVGRMTVRVLMAVVTVVVLIALMAQFTGAEAFAEENENQQEIANDEEFHTVYKLRNEGYYLVRLKVHDNTSGQDYFSDTVAVGQETVLRVPDYSDNELTSLYDVVVQVNEVVWVDWPATLDKFQISKDNYTYIGLTYTTYGDTLFSASFDWNLLYSDPGGDDLEEPAITMDITDPLTNGMNTGDAATLWFGGSNEFGWRVIGYDKEEDSGSGAFALLTDGNLGNARYYQYNGVPIDYEKSELRDSAKSTAGSFTNGEQAAMLKNDNACGDQLWALSIEEAKNVNEELRKTDATRPDDPAAMWWLRDATKQDPSFAAVVKGDGTIDETGSDVSTWLNLRPAFHLNQAQVLFISDGIGGKISGDTPETALTAVGANTSGSWKATLIEKGRAPFKVQDTAYVMEGLLSVKYTGAATGNNEWISAIIVDENGAVKYYGRIRNLVSNSDASGSCTIDLRGKYDNTKDTVYVFNEQVNGDKKTDFSSPLRVVQSPVDPGNAGEDLPTFPITFRLVNNGAYIARLKVSDGYTGDEWYTDTCASGQQAEVTFMSHAEPYFVDGYDVSVQIWAFGWFDSGMGWEGLYFNNPEVPGWQITTRGTVLSYDFDYKWLGKGDIGSDDILQPATIKATPTKVKKGKKTTVKVTSDSGAKLTVKANNAKAKKALKKKYVKVKNGKTAKITFTKKAPKGKYKFKVTSPETEGYKKTVKAITITVK
ncbi:MAG: hypothetical protein IJH41_01010 [Eubacterium sp.]|nr:hypothetical protein [Eubacterium sp.]